MLWSIGSVRFGWSVEEALYFHCIKVIKCNRMQQLFSCIHCVCVCMCACQRDCVYISWHVINMNTKMLNYTPYGRGRRVCTSWFQNFFVRLLITVNEWRVGGVGVRFIILKLKCCSLCTVYPFTLNQQENGLYSSSTVCPTRITAETAMM